MTGLDRRVFLAGLGVIGLAPGAAVARDPVEPLVGDPAIRLVSNLFTRIGAAVLIDRRGPFTFVIDTGAGTTSIADTLADQLALRPMAPMLVHGITEARVTRSVAIDRLQLGGLGFRDLACPVFARDQLGADGLIGLDVLGRFRLKFHVARGAATLDARPLNIWMGGDSVTASRLRNDGIRSVRGRFGQMIMTRVSVDGEPTAAFIDSGAQYSIGNLKLRRAISSRRRDGGQVAREVPVYGVTGQSLRADLAMVDDLRIGPQRLGPTPMLFADLHCFGVLGLAGRPALLIGADLLGRFREVTLDFPDKTVDFAGLRRQPPPGPAGPGV